MNEIPKKWTSKKTWSTWILRSSGVQWRPSWVLGTPQVIIIFFKQTFGLFSINFFSRIASWKIITYSILAWQVFKFTQIFYPLEVPRDHFELPWDPRQSFFDPNLISSNFFLLTHLHKLLFITKNQFDFCSPFLGLSWEISNYPCKTTFAQDPPKIKTWNLTNFKQRIFWAIFFVPWDQI